MRYDVILTSADSITDCWISNVDTLRFNDLSIEDAEMLVRLSKNCDKRVVAALLPVDESEGESDA